MRDSPHAVSPTSVRSAAWRNGQRSSPRGNWAARGHGPGHALQRAVCRAPEQPEREEQAVGSPPRSRQRRMCPKALSGRGLAGSGAGASPLPRFALCVNARSRPRRKSEISSWSLSPRARGPGPTWPSSPPGTAPAGVLHTVVCGLTLGRSCRKWPIRQTAPLAALRGGRVPRVPHVWRPGDGDKQHGARTAALRCAGPWSWLPPAPTSPIPSGRLT